MVPGMLSIKLRCASWQQLATIYKRDLSKGTMFLKASSPPAIGTSVRIDLALPSSSVIVLTGVVATQLHDPQRGTGVELKLAPIPAGSIWLIESALASEKRKLTSPMGVPISTSTPPGAPPPLPGVGAPGGHGVPAASPPAVSITGMIASLGDGQEVAAAEDELIRALLAEAESLKKLNPFLVLGIGYEATDADVRAAFNALTKRYHPDRFARYESTELRSVAAEIFILIRDAYRRLVDQPSRTQVLATLGRSEGPPRAMPAPRGHSVAAVPPRPPAHRPATAQIPVLRQTQAIGPAIGAQPPPADAGHEAAALEQLIDAGRLDEALAGFRLAAKRHPTDRVLRAGVELCEGLLALNLRDRLEAAQRFETALEIDPSNERAARELADMRRQATNERKGLLSRLMGKPE